MKTLFAHNMCSVTFLYFILTTLSMLLKTSFQPHYEKTRFLPKAKSKVQISCAVTAQLISTFDFATQIVQFLFFLNPKFPASSLFLRLYRPVLFRPVGKIPKTGFLASQLISAYSVLTTDSIPGSFLSLMR